MRIHFMSDIHLEFGPLNIPSPAAADVVVLAGDIGVGVKGVDWAVGENKIEGAMSLAHSRMNDYRRIRESPSWSKIRPKYTRSIHLQTRMWLRKQLETPFAGETVVVTHHSPSPLSLHPRYRADPLSAAFANRMDDRLDGSHPHAFAYPPDLWIHGHTHHCVDYTIGRTRVVSNQRGYEPGG